MAGTFLFLVFSLYAVKSVVQLGDIRVGIFTIIFIVLEFHRIFHFESVNADHLLPWTAVLDLGPEVAFSIFLVNDLARSEHFDALLKYCLGLLDLLQMFYVALGPQDLADGFVMEVLGSVIEFGILHQNIPDLSFSLRSSFLRVHTFQRPCTLR